MVRLEWVVNVRLDLELFNEIDDGSSEVIAPAAKTGMHIKVEEGDTTSAPVIDWTAAWKKGKKEEGAVMLKTATSK